MPSSLRTAIASPATGLYQQSATALASIGDRITLADGRVFIYGQAGGSTLACGTLCQNVAPAGANFDNLAVVAAQAAGDKTISVTLGGTAVTENQFAGGVLWIEDADSEGGSYTISSHPAQATTNGTLVLTLKDPLWEAVTTSSEASIDYGLGTGVIIHPSTNTSALVGVPIRDISASYYGWFCCKGRAIVLTEGTLVIGDPCMPSASVDGAVAPCAAATDLQIGTVRKVAATGEFSVVDLNLP